jgi:hypothetical protein
MPSRKKVLIVLPVVGKPYIANNLDVDANNVKDLQRVCFGDVEEVRNDWAIHPMFSRDDEMWRWVHNFIQSLRGNQYKLFVNDCGREFECPNMALIMQTKDLSSLHGKVMTKEDYDNCPTRIVNLFGRCCIQVAKTYVDKFNETSSYKLPTRYIDEENNEVESSSDSEDPYADEKAYDEYKGK